MKKLLTTAALITTSLLASQASAEVYELRTYTAHPEKLDALLTRFEDHTLRMFEKHNMRNVAYWVPNDSPLSENTLIYIVSHDNRDAAGDNWRAFISDPEWQDIAAASEADGKLVERVESVYMNLTEWSPTQP